jgi:hypothetical protein
VKKAIKVMISVVLAAMMAGLACYALIDQVQPVTQRAYSDNEFTYTGMLRNGLFDGSGEILFAGGARLIGAFRKGHCAGTLIYDAAGDWRFRGQFYSGQPDGTYTLPKLGAVTVSREDAAQLGSPAGWAYAGGIGERGQNGEGSFVFPGGERYTGSFLLGLADGHGVYKSVDGIVIYEGEWKAGLHHGQGKYTPAGKNFTYEGAFEGGLPHGRASYSQDGVVRYTGDFVGGVPEGQGIYTSPAGWTYEGGFKNGVFHGTGTLTKNGESIQGIWEKGIQREQ